MIFKYYTNAWFDNHLTDETGESIHLATTRLSGIELMFLFLYSARIYLIYNICLQLVNSSYCLHEPHVDIIDFHNTRLCVILPCLQFSPFQQYNNTLLHTLTLFLFLLSPLYFYVLSSYWCLFCGTSGRQHSPVSDNSSIISRRFCCTAESSTASLSFVSVWLKGIRSRVCVDWMHCSKRQVKVIQFNMQSGLTWGYFFVGGVLIKKKPLMLLNWQS